MNINFIKNILLSYSIILGVFISIVFSYSFASANTDKLSCSGNQGYVNGTACSQGGFVWGVCGGTKGNCNNALNCVWRDDYKSCGHWVACPKCPIIPPCKPSWSVWSNCEKAPQGIQTRVDHCGHTKSRSCVLCGPANKKTYKTTSEVEAAGRCGVSDTVSNWIDNSELTSSGGIAWTWNCIKTGRIDSDQCLAYKSGECAYDAGVNPNQPPYDTQDEACEFGAFNSVRLVNGVLYWKCGTGDKTNKHIGDFFSDNISYGSPVTTDYYGPKSGGVDCQCTPSYDYHCIATGTYTGSCNDNCGGTIKENYQATKEDISCFKGKSTFVSGEEYHTATGRYCVDETTVCPPCGAQGEQGGNYHETNN